jgi:hypothetical protein
MLLRISFSQQHQRKYRYIFAAPSDAITVVHRALRKFMRSMHRVRESESIGIGGDLRKASLPMMAAPFPHAAAAGPLPRMHW